MAISFTNEQREFIVSELACYVSPKIILAEFGLRWPTTACQPADLLQFAYDKLAPNWKAKFDEARAAFLDPPTKDANVRIGELHRLLVAAKERGAVAQVVDLIARIREECGAGGAASATGDKKGNAAIAWQIVDPAAGAP